MFKAIILYWTCLILLSQLVHFHVLCSVLPSMPCSTLLEENFVDCGRMRSTFSGQKRSSKMKTRVTRKLASSKIGTMITSCSYTRISANRNRRKETSGLKIQKHSGRVCTVCAGMFVHLPMKRNTSGIKWLNQAHGQNLQPVSLLIKTYHRLYLLVCKGSLSLKTSCQKKIWLKNDAQII